MIAPPLVGLPADVKQIDDLPFHAVGEKYLTAVADGAGCLPVTIPSLGTRIDLDAMLDKLDGVLFPGSTSNVEPRRYDGEPSKPGTLHDPIRDDSTLPMITRVLERGIPALFICRGIQELNVALGGSLHQRIQDVDGYLDHRADSSKPIGERYQPVHDIEFAADGTLIALNGGEPKLRVNSLHSQGIDRPAERLIVEATAPDGIIEAVSVADAPGFAIGIQWHPESQFDETPFAVRLFESFGAACRMCRDARDTATNAGTPVAAE